MAVRSEPYNGRHCCHSHIQQCLYTVLALWAHVPGIHCYCVVTVIVWQNKQGGWRPSPRIRKPHVFPLNETGRIFIGENTSNGGQSLTMKSLSRYKVESLMTTLRDHSRSKFVLLPPHPHPGRRRTYNFCNLSKNNQWRAVFSDTRNKISISAANFDSRLRQNRRSENPGAGACNYHFENHNAERKRKYFFSCITNGTLRLNY